MWDVKTLSAYLGKPASWVYDNHLKEELPSLCVADGLRQRVVGASAFDTYHHEEATRTFRFAADSAEEAGHWHLRAKTYSSLARQAV